MKKDRPLWIKRLVETLEKRLTLAEVEGGFVQLAKADVKDVLAALESEPLDAPSVLAVVEVGPDQFLSVEQDGAPVFARHIPGRYTMRGCPKEFGCLDGGKPDDS